MEQKYNVRQVTAEDYTCINEWYSQRKELRPKSILLPNGGLDGFIIEKNNKPIAVIYLYLTNSKMGYMDFLISDPNYKNKDKYNMIMELQDACTEALLRKGCRIVWAMTSYDHLAEMAGKMGHEVLEKKHHIIYTHEKVYKEITKKKEV